MAFTCMYAAVSVLCSRLVKKALVGVEAALYHVRRVWGI